MGEVPIKYVLKGDREAGKLFMRRGAVLMGMLEHGMTYQGLKQSVMRRWVTPDVLIECDCRFGLRTVTITVAPMTPETIVVSPQEDVFYGVVVAVSCSSGIFMHNGNWKGRPFSEGVLQYGRHQPIPDDYRFADSWNPSNDWLITGWANYPEEGRLATRQRQFIDTWFSHWIQYDANGDLRPDARYRWNNPVVMPGFDGMNYLLAYNILFRSDDDRVRYYQDHQRLMELTLQRWDEDGRQPLTTKWFYAHRGLDTGVRGNGILYSFQPMPERNGVRRYMAMPYNMFNSNALFAHVTIRDRFPPLGVFYFSWDMLAPAFPAEYGFADRASRSLNNMSAHMDAEGKVHVLCMYKGGLRANTDEDDNRDEATTKWSAALVFVTLPALSFDLTPEEEETYIRENMTVRAVPWSDFLPLLDLLHPGTHEGLKALPGGTKTMESGVAVLMQYRDPDKTTYLQYTIDGVTHHPGRRPWNPADGDIDIWGTRNWFGVVVEREAALEVLGYCVHDGGMPMDSAVFHADGAWFSWTRMWGGLSIGPAGMRRIKMTWPAEIATDGVKPIATWAGGGLYCCVCFDTKTRRVQNVYIGTPFDTAERDAWWIKLPLVSDEWKAAAGNAVMHIRPALATLERVVLLAVVKTGTIYRAAYCDGPPAEAVLNFCGVIPLGTEEEIGEKDDNFMSFDICDFGEEGFADLLKTYPSPPRAIDAKAYSAEYRYKDSRDASYWVGEWTFEEEGV